MPSWIDGSLHSDTEIPETVETFEERIDFLARPCSAWDFGVLPGAEAVAEIRRAEWCPAVDSCRLLTSPAYHMVREWHGLPRLPHPGQDLARIRDDVNLAHV